MTQHILVSLAAAAAALCSPCVPAAPAAAEATLATTAPAAVKTRLDQIYEDTWQRWLREDPTLATNIADPRYNDRWPDRHQESQ
jgi:hypothetical protein